ncbi:ribonucleoside-diphosphate reductase subunit alpha [Psittacicella melopsittaci]|uniref:Ribonucleoside-diphosphate reductase n=1 Tax=Psittacicella melopsittaci TaxID=2028576 RepID=A0A3A1Y0W0_9GAMM|nr:class 1a ribonucleoside-diphosphate reductase subunit alpha [Psittacicella melopsittaci]RIY31883.1 ribonucleoside-diphosphate reductase subunit alpha [Psittacicella melopsittaci]
MIENISVTKRDGRREPLDLDKIHRVVSWAAQDLENVSVSLVELRSQVQFVDGMKTSDIHELLIKSAADLITEETPDYQFLAARLAVFHLRKKAFGKFDPPKLLDHVTNLVNLGKYDEELLEKYTPEEYEILDSFLQHERDLDFAYAGVKQLEGKYLVQDRVTKQIYESAQFLYLLIAASLFADYPKETRLDYIKRFYDAVSTFKISLPTPIMAGVRTPTRQFSSCVLIECDDSLDSINATSSAIVKYVSQRAGIGINAGRIRAIGSKIRGGEAYHTGVIPFYKLFQAAVKSCSQGGVRGGAATVFYPLWHREARELLVLKNNRGVEDNRVRQLDYGVQINGFLYNRLKTKEGVITLFSPSEVPGLYDAFFEDQDEFARLYEKYEQDPSINKVKVPAVELFSSLMQERASTGRIYIHNVDNTNTHSAFNPKKAPIRQSNLCLEITLPTKPLNHIFDEEGEIALCTLSAFNLGAIEDLNELEELADLIVRALDSLMDYQNYPIKAAEISTKRRRSLGIGVINYAYYLAKNGVKYTDGSAKDLTHRTFEAIQYYCLKASNRLAQERGACEYFGDTNYAQGLLPIDHYSKNLDKVSETELELNWEELRTNIARWGLRNSTLTSLMPSETSSQISNATNGIEPPRGFVTIKQSKDGILRQVVPEILKYRQNYELLWTWPDNRGYLELVGIMQKFVDQSISANTNYDPAKFPGNKVPMQQLLKDLLLCHKLGIKTLYYHNTNDGASDRTDDDCAGGACKI